MVSNDDFLARYKHVSSGYSTLPQTDRDRIMHRYHAILRSSSFGFEAYNIPVAAKGNPSLLVYLYEQRHREWGQPVVWEDGQAYPSLISKYDDARSDLSSRASSTSNDSSQWSQRGESPQLYGSVRRPSSLSVSTTASDSDTVRELATRAAEQAVPQYNERDVDRATKGAILHAQATTIDALSYGNGGLRNTQAVLTAQRVTVESLLRAGGIGYRSSTGTGSTGSRGRSRSRTIDRYRPAYSASFRKKWKKGKGSNSSATSGRELYPDTHRPGFQKLMPPRRYRGISPSRSRSRSGWNSISNGRSRSQRRSGSVESVDAYFSSKGSRFYEKRRLIDRITIPKNHPYGPAAFEPLPRISYSGSIRKTGYNSRSSSRCSCSGFRRETYDRHQRRASSCHALNPGYPSPNRDDRRSQSVSVLYEPHENRYGFLPDNYDYEEERKSRQIFFSRFSGQRSGYNRSAPDYYRPPRREPTPPFEPVEYYDLGKFGPVTPYNYPPPSVSAHARSRSSSCDRPDQKDPFEITYKELYEERYGRPPSLANSYSGHNRSLRRSSGSISLSHSTRSSSGEYEGSHYSRTRSSDIRCSVESDDRRTFNVYAQNTTIRR